MLPEGLHILLVEDNPEHIVPIRNALERNGWTVNVISDGQEALTLLLKSPGDFHLVLLDHHLPGVSGLEVIRTLAAKKVNLPIIFLTSGNDVEQISQAMQLGALDFVPKTKMSMDDLPDTVSKVFDISNILSNSSLMEKKYREAEQKFNTAFYHNPSTMVITRFSDGRYIDVNKIFINKLGYKREEVIGLTSADLNLFVHAHEREEFRIRLKEEKRIRDFEMSIYTKNRQVRTGLFSAEIITLDGEPCLLSIMTDITERKAAETLNRTLVENVPHGLIITQGIRLVYFNTKASKILGYPESQLARMTPFQKIRLIDKHDRSLLIGKLRDVMAGREDKFRLELRMRRRNGRLMWLEYYLSRIEFNQATAFHHMFINISGQKRDARVLMKNEQKLSRITESMSDVLMQVDNQGLIVFCSPSVKRILGFQPADWEGKTFGSIFLQPDQAMVNNYFTNGLRNQKPYTFECKLAAASGKQLWFDVRCNYLLTGNGEIAGTVVNCMDISRRKAVEITLQNQRADMESQRNQLKELIGTKDKFFSIIAHDLKNPFNNIQGFAELLLRNFERYDEEKIKSFLKIIYDLSNRSYELLQNLLEWARAQRGTIEFKPILVNLRQIVEENINLLGHLATRKKLKVFNEIAGDIEIIADYNMLMTVFRNLFSNAIKFTMDNGSITFQAEPDDSGYIISVTDTGVGIKEKELPKLFRLDVNTSTIGTSGEDGTGIGLILCKEFVEKHQGKIWVESEFGEGSKFRFSLPKGKI